MSFSTSYSDTGLFGVYMVSENLTNLDDLTHFLFKEWQRLATHPTDTEVSRAKAQLKASLLLGLDGTTAVATAVAEDIGRQFVTSGRRLAPKEIAAGARRSRLACVLTDRTERASWNVGIWPSLCM
ncbi:putative Acetyl-CoA C-acetyltransferase [Rhodotorula taiwanensis]|uniref:mitochondrial processing peptidase n=1 Tax=Rhodotorula taiwanensis TaxID=741276 RepID=A0A2S5BIC9_9BASI|nr:putative Acetyl-CoA C-acetyltransferase [Rhodotorula taiwanensis]